WARAVCRHPRLHARNEGALPALRDQALGLPVRTGNPLGGGGPRGGLLRAPCDGADCRLLSVYAVRPPALHPRRAPASGRRPLAQARAREDAAQPRRRGPRLLHHRSVGQALCRARQPARLEDRAEAHERDPSALERGPALPASRLRDRAAVTARAAGRLLLTGAGDPARAGRDIRRPLLAVSRRDLLHGPRAAAWSLRDRLPERPT